MFPPTVQRGIVFFSPKGMSKTLAVLGMKTPYKIILALLIGK